MRIKASIVPTLLAVIAFLSACDNGGQESATQAAIRDFPTPQGRILTANQASDTLSIIDVATGTAYTAIGTGKQPHHVVSTPDGKEFWVSLYGENRVQVFDAHTLKEIASVDVGGVNDDLVFDPEGKRLYVSLGKNNAVAVVDVAARKLLQTVPVGRTPHGVRVTPDGKFLLITNTADNTLSILSLQPQAAVQATATTGADPFEIIISDDSKTAYVSNFLGDSIQVIDIATRKTVGYIRSGKQPAMLALQNGSEQKKLWIANTGSSDVWVVDAATRKLVTKIPVGKGAHGVVLTPTGKAFVTNSTDNTVSVIDEAQAALLQTIAVGNNPNGLTFLPNIQTK